MCTWAALQEPESQCAQVSASGAMAAQGWVNIGIVTVVLGMSDHRDVWEHIGGDWSVVENRGKMWYIIAEVHLPPTETGVPRC